MLSCSRGGEGREDLSERCRIVVEGRESSHYLEEEGGLTLQEMILSSGHDGGACSWEAISLKKLSSVMRQWDLWRVIGGSATLQFYFYLQRFG